MDQEDEFNYLNLGQAKYQKLVPYNPSTNASILYTAALLRAYRAFTTTIEALEASFYRREKVLQFPGRERTIKEPDLVTEEFVAEKNVNY
jgi:hypothetical protein